MSNKGPGWVLTDAPEVFACRAGSRCLRGRNHRCFRPATHTDNYDVGSGEAACVVGGGQSKLPIFSALLRAYNILFRGDAGRGVEHAEGGVL